MPPVTRDFIVSIALVAAGIAVILLLQRAPGITGMVVAKANVSQALPDTCAFTIPAGKDLVSFYCIPKDADRDNVTAYIASLDRMFAYDTTDSSDPWKAYKPGLPNWTVQDLDTMSREEAYWLFMDAASDFSYDGLAVAGQHISMVQGWNLVGMATDTVAPLSTVFTSLNGNYNLVLSFNSTSKAVLAYYPLGNGVNTINTSSPFIGYWVNMSAADTWDVP